MYHWPLRQTCKVHKVEDKTTKSAVYDMGTYANSLTNNPHLKYKQTNICSSPVHAAQCIGNSMGHLPEIDSGLNGDFLKI